MSFVSEFRDFAMRGNVVDMAVGVVIGGAFGKIVSSFVSDLITPLLGVFTGGTDFSSLFINLSGGEYATLAAAEEAGAAVLKIGVFLNTVLDFLIVVFAIFMAVKAMNQMQARLALPPASRDCPECCSAIPAKATRCPQCTAPIAAAA